MHRVHDGKDDKKYSTRAVHVSSLTFEEKNPIYIVTNLVTKPNDHFTNFFYREIVQLKIIAKE